MSTILVTTDFSELSENAAVYAAGLGQDKDCRLVLLHAYILPVSVTPSSINVVSDNDFHTAAMENMDKLETRLQNAGFRGEIRKIVKEGVLLEVMLETVQAEEPFLIVMATTGKGKFETLLIGSNTFNAIQEMHVPVMVVPKDAVYKPIKRIGVSCDFKHVKETVPNGLVKSFASFFKAELHFVNVDSGNQQYAMDAPAEYRDIKSEFPNEAMHFIKSKEITEGIDMFIRDVQIDCLMMFPRKHGLLTQIFGESNTRKIALHTHIPVLAIHK